MNALTKICLAVIAVFTATADGMAQLSPTDQALESTVLIRVRSQADYGSGFIVGAEGNTVYVATALHVLVMAERDSDWRRRPEQLQIEVEFRGKAEKRFRATLFERWDEDADLGVLVVDDPAIAKMNPSVGYVISGERLADWPLDAIVVGHPGRSEWVMRGVQATGRSGPRLTLGRVRLEPRERPNGLSGGAVLGARGNQLLGMMLEVTEGRGEALSIEALRERLDRWRVPHQLRESAVAAPMVKVPAGSFLMGMDSGDMESYPQRRIYLDQYLIDKFEVTVRNFRQFVEESGHRYEPGLPTCNFGKTGGEGLAMNCVSWEDANAFCRWAGKRLPHESEWEKAARGMDGRLRPWGNERPSAGDAALQIDWPLAPGGHPRDRSVHGAMDMLGNLLEWTADWFDADYYTRMPARNPAGPADTGHKALRGGSFLTKPDSAILTKRLWNIPTIGRQKLEYGLRCATPQ